MKRGAMQKSLKHFNDIRRNFVEGVTFDLYSCDRATLKVTYELSIDGKVQGLMDCKFVDMAGWMSGVHDPSLRRECVSLSELLKH